MVAERVWITEVGPRDGLQNQPQSLSVEQRICLIDSLIAAGLNHIEMGSFVSPNAVPAMAKSDEVMAGLVGRSAKFSALVPNRRGYDNAHQAGVPAVNLVVAASNTFNLKNINRSTEQVLAACAEIIACGRADGIDVVPYVATAWECPFEGGMDSGKVLALFNRLIDFGASRVVLADTIGAATPAQVTVLTKQAIALHGEEAIACHFHDTRGFAGANAFAALEQGVRRFDSSVGGLGGCPFAPGATGNVATEDLVLLFEQMGFSTGINLDRLLETIELVKQLTGNCSGGHSLAWLQRRQQRDNENKKAR